MLLASRRIAELREKLEAGTERGHRYEALRLASDGSPHETPQEIVKRAEAYLNFLKGESQ